MTENRNAYQQGQHEERSAVGDFIYQAGTDASAGAVVAAGAAAVTAVVKKVTGGGKEGSGSSESE
jgi:hypothetical protein